MRTPFRLLLGAALCVVGLLPLAAQQPVPSATPPVGVPPPLQGQAAPQRIRQITTPPNATTPQRAPLIPLLSRNYVLRITVTEGDKVTEYKLVSAASQVSISTPGTADGAPAASIDGQIEESEEGHIGVALAVSLAVPEPAPVQPGVTPQPGVSFQPGRGRGQSESFSASLRVTLGVEYSLFTTGARTYRLTITPHEEKASALPK